MLKLKDLKKDYVYLSTTDLNFLIVVESIDFQGDLAILESWTEIKGETRQSMVVLNKNKYVGLLEVGIL